MVKANSVMISSTRKDLGRSYVEAVKQALERKYMRAVIIERATAGPHDAIEKCCSGFRKVTPI